MNHILAVMFCIVVSFTAGIITLTYGWGLTIKSWPVIIGMAMFGFLWIIVISSVTSSMQKAMNRWIEKHSDKEA